MRNRSCQTRKDRTRRGKVPCQSPLWGLLLLLAGYTPVHAEEAAEEGEKTWIEGEAVVVTASRTEEDLLFAPAALTLLSQEEIEAESVPILPNLLAGAMGVTVQNTTYAQGSPFVRGVTGTGVLILVDGIRLNNAIFRSAPNQYSALIDPFDIERIEVIRGTASTLYGSDAMGGVVHFMTVEPRFQGEAFQWAGRVKGGFASADLSEQTHLALSGGNERQAHRLALSFSQFRDLRDGSGTRQHPTGFDTIGAAYRVRFIPGRGQRLRFDLSWFEQPSAPRYDQVSVGFGQETPAFERFDFEPNRRVFGHLRYRTDQDLHFADRVTLDLAVQRIVDDRKRIRFGETSLNHERNRDDLFAGTLDFHTPIGRGGDMIWGVEVYQDFVASHRSETAQDGTVTEKTARFPDGSRIGTYAAFAEPRIFLTDRFRVSAGARWSLFDIDIAKADRPDGVRRTLSDLTGQVNLLWRAAPGFHVVGNVGRGFRIPNVNDFSKFAPSANRYDVPNPTLDPEKVLSADLGMKTALRRISGELFGFYSHYTDRIAARPVGREGCETLAETFEEVELLPEGEADPSACVIEGLPVFSPQNSDRVDIWGVESGVRLSLTPQVGWWGRLTYTFGEERTVEGVTQPADRIPPLNGESGLRYTRPTWWAEFFVRFAGRQDRLHPINIEDPRIDPNGTPGWITLNVGASWHFLPGWRVNVALENLTDTFYRVHGSGINAPGIDFLLSLSATFGGKGGTAS